MPCEAAMVWPHFRPRGSPCLQRRLHSRGKRTRAARETLRAAPEPAYLQSPMREPTVLVTASRARPVFGSFVIRRVSSVKRLLSSR
jgi:hypothetical protein